MLLCPFCDGQGLINKAIIKETDIKIFICEECDTIWLTDDIQEDNCLNFKEFMSKLGRNPFWSELSEIERVQILK